jgi:hypothetical protein
LICGWAADWGGGRYAATPGAAANGVCIDLSSFDGPSDFGHLVSFPLYLVGREAKEELLCKLRKFLNKSGSKRAQQGFLGPKKNFQFYLSVGGDNPSIKLPD